VLAAVAVLFGNARRDHPYSLVPMFLILAAFAAPGNWIAFDPGSHGSGVVGGLGEYLKSGRRS
jgi:hypothetical protein